MKFLYLIIPQIIEELIFELNKTRKDFPLGGIESYNGIVDSYIKAEPINNLGQKNNNDSSCIALADRYGFLCLSYAIASTNNNLINMNLNGKVISIFLLLFNLIPFLDQSSGFININYPFVLSTSCLGFPILNEKDIKNSINNLVASGNKYLGKSSVVPSPNQKSKSSSFFRLQNRVKYLPTVYSNITSKEINAISRLSSAVLLKRNLDSFKLILTDPLIKLILNNALSPQTRQNIDFSNSILKNDTFAHTRPGNIDKKPWACTGMRVKNKISIWSDPLKILATFRPYGTVVEEADVSSSHLGPRKNYEYIILI
uniref:Uncharacterized protein n=1 Tax=Wolfiporia cocos TaxID=81056 RepID=A0A7G7YDS2_9APHY|nr:hypothetical protein [Wolfiporia cocos]QNH92642.1 hypothetical protein [Wolfiporia cocos]QNH92719.1 hypothetical protein [Wolfiporia cocos]